MVCSRQSALYNVDSSSVAADYSTFVQDVPELTFGLPKSGVKFSHWCSITDTPILYIKLPALLFGCEIKKSLH